MSDIQHRNDVLKTVMMLTWGLLQALLLALFMWGASTIRELDRTMAGLIPVIQKLDRGSDQIVGRVAYDRDIATHAAEHVRLVQQVLEMSTRITEIRLESARFGLPRKETAQPQTKEP